MPSTPPHSPASASLFPESPGVCPHPNAYYRFTLVSAGAALATLYLTRLYHGPDRRRAWLQNCSLLLFTVLYTVLILEIIVQVTFVQTDGMAFTLSSKLWFERHWHPINRFGFRDPEYDIEALRAKKRLFVVGDSFVAGHGIADVRDRFSNVLGRKLGKNWRVMSVARLGWDAPAELAAMRQLPVKPRVIVFSYVFNDIEGAADRHGLGPDTYVSMPPGYLQRIINKSYLLNLVYWRFYWRILKGPKVSAMYHEFLARSFRAPRIWKTHRADLVAIIDFAAEADAKLLVVVFPSILDPAGTREIMTPLFHLFQEKV